jgi:cytochrome c-type biogenesis protein CcmH/NrfG
MLQRIERVGLALALFAVPVAFATGLSQYEVAKQAGLMVLGGVVLIAWTWRFCSARQDAVAHGGHTLTLGGLFLLFAGISVIWTTSTAESLRALSIWVPLFAIFASIATQPSVGRWVVFPLGAAGVVVALSVLAQRFGLEVPPAIPTGFNADAGAHGLFDHAASAGAFLVVVGPLVLYSLTRSAKPIVAVAAIAIYLAIGVTGSAVTIVAIAALLLGALLSLRSQAGKEGAMWVWGVAAAALVAVVVGQFALGAPTPEPEEESPLWLVSNPYDDLRIGAQENAITSLNEWTYEAERALTIREGAPLLGSGIGTWSVMAGLGADPEHRYRQSESVEYPEHGRPPGSLLGVLVELGIVGLVLWVLFLTAVLVVALRSRQSHGYLVAAFLSAVAVIGVSAAAYHAGEGIALFAILALTLRADPVGGRTGLLASRAIPAAKGAFVRFERWVLVGVPAVVLMVASGWVGWQAVAADFQRQRGEVFQAATPRRGEQAIESFERAVQLWPSDPLAHYLLGLAMYYVPTDEDRLAHARASFARAAELRPFDIRTQIQAIRADMRRRSEGVEGSFDAAREARNRLTNLMSGNPSYVPAALLLSEAHRILADYNRAAAILIEALASMNDREELARTHLLIGQIFEENLDLPDDALSHYRSAMDLAHRGTTLERRLVERISFVQQWTETGFRPRNESDD